MIWMFKHHPRWKFSSTCQGFSRKNLKTPIKNFKTPPSKKFFSFDAGAYPREDLSVKTSTSMKVFFNLLEFFEKKIPKHHPKFCRPYKKNLKQPPLKNFWVRPCFDVVAVCSFQMEALRFIKYDLK